MSIIYKYTVGPIVFSNYSDWLYYYSPEPILEQVRRMASVTDCEGGPPCDVDERARSSRHKDAASEPGCAGDENTCTVEEATPNNAPTRRCSSQYASLHHSPALLPRPAPP
jgi:hypothetical protein